MIKSLTTCSLALVLLALPFSTASAQLLDQWASTLIEVSSEFNPSPGGSWSGSQALGAPDTFSHGDINTAWAPLLNSDGLQSITLGYTTPVYAYGAIIRETYNPGFVTQVEVIDTNDVNHVVWSGTDTSPADQISDFAVNWTQTTYLVDGLKITIDTDHHSSWEEIDAVQLRGTAVPEPTSVAMLLAAVSLLAFRRRVA